MWANEWRLMLAESRRHEPKRHTEGGLEGDQVGEIERERERATGRNRPEITFDSARIAAI